MPRGWKLMWGQTTTDIVKAAEAYPFYRIGPDNTLCYGRPKQADGLKIADDAFVRKLTPDEQIWVKGCIDKIVTDKAAKNKTKRNAETWEILHRWEDNLKAARAQMDSEVGTNGADS